MFGDQLVALQRNQMALDLNMKNTTVHCSPTFEYRYILQSCGSVEDISGKS